MVLGPHAVGAKDLLGGRAASVAGALLDVLRSSPVPLPAPVPKLPVQFIHEEDVGEAFRLCILGAGPPGVYNITGDGILTAADVARELGLRPVPVPGRIVQAAARLATAVPRPRFMPPTTEWLEAVTQPPIMDASKAKRELGWQPRYTSLEALRETLAARG